TDAQSAFQTALGDYVEGREGAADAHDEAVAESYPASDPPANGVPGHAPALATAAAGGAAQAGGAAPGGGAAQAGGAATAGDATAQRHNGFAAQVQLDGESFQ